MNVPPTTSGPQMYCRGCGYMLVGLPSNRCPECGREFDPGDAKSFLARPRRGVLRLIIKIILILFCLTLPADVYFGNLVWEVHQERTAIQFLRNDGAYIKTCDTTPSWAKALLPGRTAWLWERADEVIYRYMATTDASLAHLKSLTALRGLYLPDLNVTDTSLSNLKGMTSLQVLWLLNTQVTDAGLGNLKGLKALRRLELGFTPVTDAGIVSLQKSLPNCIITPHPKGPPATTRQGWRGGV